MEALLRLDPLWEQLVPAEQARIARSRVGRVVVGPTGADIRLRLEGLHGLVRDLTAIFAERLEECSMTTATSITVRVPMAIRHWPGRKTVVTPMTDGVAPVTTRADPALVKAMARAFRYQRMLDEGRYASISKMAAPEPIERGYLGTLLRLTLLAPDVVEAILDAQGLANVRTRNAHGAVPGGLDGAAQGSRCCFQRGAYRCSVDRLRGISGRR